MNKKYFVYWGNYANTYRVVCSYTDISGQDATTDNPDGWERVTLKHARELTKRERDRRAIGQGGFASAYIEEADKR